MQAQTKLVMSFFLRVKHIGSTGEILLDPLEGTEWCFNTPAKPPAKGKEHDERLKPKTE